MGRKNAHRILGVIPARGGSKGIPRKNLAQLMGKPLIQYTFEAARSSRELDRVILSTDDEEIATLARECGIEVPFRRPKSLSGDSVPCSAVARHAVEWVRGHEHYQPGAVVLLQPTSPLRRPEHIDGAVRLFQRGQAESVVSVCAVREHPFEMVTLAGGRLRRLMRRPSRIRGRQQYPPVYWVNGAIYVTRPSVVLRSDTLYGASVRGFIMDEADSIDIDTPLDLLVAACLIRGRRSR